MIFKLFKINNYSQVDVYLDEFFSVYKLDKNALRMSRTTASYRRPFIYEIQGEINKRDFTLVFQASEEKTDPKRFRTSFILNIKNPAWISLLFCPDNRKQNFVQNLSSKEIKLKGQGWHLSCSHENFINNYKKWIKTFSGVDKTLMDHLKLERHRLSVAFDFLPLDPSSAKKMNALLGVAFKMAHQVDAFSS